MKFLVDEERNTHYIRMSDKTDINRLYYNTDIIFRYNVTAKDSHSCIIPFQASQSFCTVMKLKSKDCKIIINSITV